MVQPVSKATEAPATAPDTATGFVRGLGLLDSTMIVAGSMIGSGIFIVSADITRQVGSAGWLLLVWIVTGLLTYLNTRGIKLGKAIQNVFTSAKTLSLLALIAIGILFARQAAAVSANFGDFWTPRDVSEIRPDISFFPAVSAAAGAMGLLI